jgi:glycine cleavage system H protein
MSHSNIPGDLRYGPEHEWTSVDEHGIATVGITDYAQDQLGDVQYVDYPVAGSKIAQGAVLLEIESTKTVSEVYAPVSGAVVEVNDLLVDEPTMIPTTRGSAGSSPPIRPSWARWSRPSSTAAASKGR